jgi:hypothetical protein
MRAAVRAFVDRHEQRQLDKTATLWDEPFAPGLDHLGLTDEDPLRALTDYAAWAEAPPEAWLDAASIEPDPAVRIPARFGRVGAAAVVLVPPLGGEAATYAVAARALSWRGLRVGVVELPGHGTRSVPHLAPKEHLLSANLGQAHATFRQAIAEVRQAVADLRAEGAPSVSLAGLSVGSAISAVASLYTDGVDRVALTFVAGDLADVAWHAPLTAGLRQHLEPHVDLPTLTRIWRPMGTFGHLPALARVRSHALIVTGERDRICTPTHTRHILAAADDAGLQYRHVPMSCGHYSMGLPPWSLRWLREVGAFLAP